MSESRGEGQPEGSAQPNSSAQPKNSDGQSQSGQPQSSRPRPSRLRPSQPQSGQQRSGGNGQSGGGHGQPNKSDPVADFQRWLMKAGARSMANQVAGQVKRTIGAERRDSGDV